MLLFAPPVPQSTPLGFMPVLESELRERQLPERNWRVSFDRGRLRVEDMKAYFDRVPSKRHAKVEPKVVLPIEALVFSGPWALDPGVRVADGSLHALDGGEWGGGIFWIAPSGRPKIQISDANTLIVARLRGGIFAVQSLAHMMFNFSRLVRVDRVRGKWTTRLVTDLHVPIREAVREGDRFVYLGYDGFVSTLEPDGRQREIYRDHTSQSLFSLTRAPDGTLWVGARSAVLRLTPGRGGEYAEQWFAPLP